MFRTYFVATLMLLAIDATAYACTQPAEPTHSSQFATYVGNVEVYLRCTHERDVLSVIDRRGSWAEKEAASARQDSLSSSMWNHVYQVVGPRLAANAAGGSQVVQVVPNVARPAATDCAQLERESVAQMQSLQARMGSAGLCSSYGLAIELGQIGERMYSSCPILDPTGANLAAARQMIADGRSGQSATCTR